jgi:signal recognition particle subunit SRP68
MSFKSSNAADQKGITGRTRTHIISRLTKATRSADSLVEALSQSDGSGASTTDILEAKAYAAMIRGATLFEKKTWESCLRSYATVRLIYSSLTTTARGDIFKDLLSETIDPSIRYAAYQLKTPRTIPISVIALKAFPQSDSALVGEISQIAPNILKQGDEGSAPGTSETGSVPRTLNWRSREVNIEDAQIALAWGSVQGAKGKLAEKLGTLRGRSAYEVAAAYDEILTATQDAVDATKQAIDELRSEGVGQGDARMQSLQITRTAVNYEMISWRIGRNRVLTGAHDGATEEYGNMRRRGKSKAVETPEEHGRDLPSNRKLAKLKENVALYDGTLQNLQSIKELPGIAADEELATRIEGFAKYFESLK